MEKGKGAAFGFAGEGVGGAMESGGVDDLKKCAHGAEVVGDVVARGAGLVAGDGAVVSEQGVEKGGLPDVGLSGEDDYGRVEEFSRGVPALYESEKSVSRRGDGAGGEECGDAGHFAGERAAGLSEKESGGAGAGGSGKE